MIHTIRLCSSRRVPGGSHTSVLESGGTAWTLWIHGWWRDLEALEGKGLPNFLIRTGRHLCFRRGLESRLQLDRSQDASGLYRSDDGGENWTKVNDDQRLTQRAWYFTHIFADPKNADTVYMLNTGMFRSQDDG